MKAIQSISQFIPVVFFSLVLMAISLDSSAQHSRNNKKSDKNKDHKEYRNDHSRSSDHFEGRNDGRRGDKKQYKGYNSGRYDGNYAYSEHNSSRSMHSQENYFNHPKYGRIYQKFDHKPTIFRHSQGNYYYSGNQFYTYREGIGYCNAEPPRQLYFRDLPFSCNRVHVNNQVFFRHGDLYFSHSSRGYVIVPPPIEVNFSFSF